MKSEPELTVFRDGVAPVNEDHWEERRKELIDVLSREEYGRKAASAISAATVSIS